MINALQLSSTNSQSLLLRPSARGELEVTDINNAYLNLNKLHAEIIDGWWADSGCSIDGLLQAGIMAKELRGGDPI